ncbi:MAG: DUF2330 domain-containing protein, partial [Candidatus Parabeggiatoa sp. nov. 1]
YRQTLKQRQEREAQKLASLTGWDINQIRRKMGISSPATDNNQDGNTWWQKIWEK